MSDIKKSMQSIAKLEELTDKDTPIHRLQPSVKLLATIIYIITVISYGPYQISGLLPFIIYPVVLMTLGEIPLKPLFQRLLVALPFALFTGITNLFISREIIYTVWSIGITEGMISFCSILMKTILTVMAVLILVATTNINNLAYVMVNFRIPSIIVIQIMLTYRYISVLMEEVSVMYNAYLLRAPKEKAIKMKDMGPFLGNLILRSFDRADRIYAAMKCRGFDGSFSFLKQAKISAWGWSYLVVVGLLCLFLRLFNLSEFIGKIIYK